jgi:hypothetical protein
MGTLNMKPDFAFKIFKAEKLVVKKYSGLVGLDFIKTARERVIAHRDFCQSFGILCDWRDCTMNLSTTDLSELIRHHHQVFVKNHSRISILVGSPRETAICMLFAPKIKSRLIQYFSTEEAAYLWLGLEGNPEQKGRKD